MVVMPYEKRMDNLLQGFSLVALLFIYNVGLVIKVRRKKANPAEPPSIDVSSLLKLAKVQDRESSLTTNALYDVLLNMSSALVLGLMLSIPLTRKVRLRKDSATGLVCVAFDLMTGMVRSWQHHWP